MLRRVLLPPCPNPLPAPLSRLPELRLSPTSGKQSRIPQAQLFALPAALHGHFLYFHACYIAHGAPMEVNLPATVRKTISDAMETGARVISCSVFDRAVDEVVAMIYYNTFAKFVKEKEKDAGHRASVSAAAPTPADILSTPISLAPLPPAAPPRPPVLPPPPRTSPLGPRQAQSLDIERDRERIRTRELSRIAVATAAAQRRNRTLARPVSVADASVDFDDAKSDSGVSFR
ncbi:hypothetical protein BDK51DRAFT_34944, partial [Blyttiomyces helicus]